MFADYFTFVDLWIFPSNARRSPAAKGCIAGPSLKPRSVLHRRRSKETAKCRFPNMGVAPNHFLKWDFPLETIHCMYPHFQETSKYSFPRESSCGFHGGVIGYQDLDLWA